MGFFLLLFSLRCFGGKKAKEANKVGGVSTENDEMKGLFAI